MTAAAEEKRTTRKRKEAEEEVDAVKVKGVLGSLEKKQKKKQQGTEGGKGLEAEVEEAGVGDVKKEKTKKKKKEKSRKEEEEKGEDEEGCLDEEEGLSGLKEEAENSKRKKNKKNTEKETTRNDAELNGTSKKTLNCESEKKDSLDRWSNIAIAVSGRGSEDPQFRALKSFSEFVLPESVTESLASFQQPSPIQAHSWPVLKAGRDLIGIAATGSGKTLAFGVPALLHILEKRKRKNGGIGSPTCLMLAPTRELVQQIAEVLEGLGKPSKVGCVCICGGVNKGPQRSAMRQQPGIMVATPGRLLDFLEEGAFDLSNVSYVVLDEADRMLDLGFEPAIRAILGRTPKERQTVMLSATWPPAVGQLASEFVKDPIKITIGSKDLSANHDVTQIVEVVEDRARDARLDALLRQYHKSRKNRVLVFVLYKKEAVRVENMLSARGWSAGAVHGDKGQGDRTRAVQQFKSGAVPLLIATDVAARGLDIPDVEYVINYSFPLTTEDYVHRIGRTGRAGRKGTAHTFFTSNDKPRAGELVNVLREAGQNVPEDLLKFGTTVKKKESKLYGAHFREITEDTPKAKKITFADSDEE